MTLNLTKLLQYSITKEMLISHFENCSVLVVEENLIPEDMRSRILDKYGRDYLNDGNLFVFFKTKDALSFQKDSEKKMFKFVDRAFGKEANNSSENDFMNLGSNLKFIKVTFANGGYKDDSDDSDDSAEG